MIKAILVDDERNALDALQDALSPFRQIEIVGKFTNPLEALERLHRLQAHVVFLDIDMPGINGLEVAEKWVEREPSTEIIFITAYDQYAVEAFEVSALDYLLKPVRHERMEKTVEKLIAKCKIEENAETACDGCIICFGNFQIRVSPERDDHVKWRTNKVRELFAYLVHHRGKDIHKARIIEDLWPDMDAERATAYLHTCIYQIRKTIKQHRLQGQITVHYANDRYRLVMNEIRCDTDEFMQFAGGNQEVTAETIDAYEHAASLYRGDYLEGSDYSWADSFRQKLLLMYFGMVKKMAVYYMDDKQYTQALMHLGQLIAISPLEEEIHEILLKTYAAAGDQTMLAEHYNGMERMFFEELGVGLRPQTKALYKQLHSELN